MNITSKLTVYFEDPFWVGSYERICGNKYEVSRIVFGPEPKDYEVYDFINNRYSHMRFTDSITCKEMKDKKVNPKRLQRKIKKQTENNGAGTMAQEAIKLQYGNNKLERKKASKKITEEEQERKFSLRLQKKREKHKGH